MCVLKKVSLTFSTQSFAKFPWCGRRPYGLDCIAGAEALINVEKVSVSWVS